MLGVGEDRLRVFGLRDRHVRASSLLHCLCVSARYLLRSALGISVFAFRLERWGWIWLDVVCDMRSVGWEVLGAFLGVLPLICVCGFPKSEQIRLLLIAVLKQR